MLGPDHPTTLATRGNLLYCRANTGEVTNTLTTFDQLLADQKRVLGTNHPLTARTRANIAHYRNQT